jgi:hypothetical protein
LDVITKGEEENAPMEPAYEKEPVHGNPIHAAAAFSGLGAAFRVARRSLPSYRRDMGQQHRVRTKRRRRAAYLDRKKVAAKAAPVRREPPKTTKAKPKKQAAASAET